MQAFPLWTSFFFFFWQCQARGYKDGEQGMLSGKRVWNDGKALKPSPDQALLPCTAIKSDHESTLVGPHSSSCHPLENPETTERQDPCQDPQRRRLTSTGIALSTSGPSKWGSELQKKGGHLSRTASPFRGLRLSFWVTMSQGMIQQHWVSGH